MAGSTQKKRNAHVGERTHGPARVGTNVTESRVGSTREAVAVTTVRGLTKDDSPSPSEPEVEPPIDSGVMFIQNGDNRVMCAPDGCEFVKLLLVTDCVFGEINPSPGYAVVGMSAVSLVAGLSIDLRAENFRMNSGSLLAYYARKG